MNIKILTVDDNKESLFVTKHLLKPYYTIFEATTKKECLEILQKENIQLVVLDLLMPDVHQFELLEIIKSEFQIPVIMLTSAVDIQKAVKAIQRGADDYIIKEQAEDQLLISISKIIKQKQLDFSVQAYQETLKLSSDDILILKHPAYQKCYELALNAIDCGLNVLILGETGTGKDILARYIHQKLKPNQPYIPINCGSICSGLAESELFGHEKGAFTDAYTQKIGKLELANNGILFLDEIGNMPLPIQAQLLRILEDKQLMRVGSSKIIEVDFSLISATNINLVKAIEKKEFRSDLYYRINQAEVYLPSINQFPEVILELASYFIDKFNHKYQKKFQLSNDYANYLTSKNWQGNIRELKNEIQLKIALIDKQPLQNLLEPFQLPNYLRTIEKAYLEKTLGVYQGNISKTALFLGIKRTTLINKMKQFGLGMTEKN
ncbi:MAG: sigma-54 dependent transcriptional regulator [Candidatus Margulisiibacteriota bacterium]|jgi:two-component system response regulator AtoC